MRYKTNLQFVQAQFEKLCHWQTLWDEAFSLTCMGQKTASLNFRTPDFWVGTASFDFLRSGAGRKNASLNFRTPDFWVGNASFDFCAPERGEKPLRLISALRIFGWETLRLIFALRSGAKNRFA